MTLIVLSIFWSTSKEFGLESAKKTCIEKEMWDLILAYVQSLYYGCWSAGQSLVTKHNREILGLKSVVAG